MRCIPGTAEKAASRSAARSGAGSAMAVTPGQFLSKTILSKLELSLDIIGVYTMGRLALRSGGRRARNSEKFSRVNPIPMPLFLAPTRRIGS
jgi:hypothetical protein